MAPLRDTPQMAPLRDTPQMAPLRGWHHCPRWHHCVESEHEFDISDLLGSEEDDHDEDPSEEEVDDHCREANDEPRCEVDPSVGILVHPAAHDQEQLNAITGSALKRRSGLALMVPSALEQC